MTTADYQPQTTGPTDQDKYKRIANNVWWIVMIQGLVLLIIGLFLLLQPATSISFVAQIAGIYLVVINTLTIVQWVLGMSRTQTHAYRSLALAVLGVVIGVVIALVPSLIANLVSSFLFLFVGIGLVLFGAFHLIQASMSRYVDGASSRHFMLGMVWVVIGLMIMLAPRAATGIIIRLLGIIAVGGGAGMMYFSLYLRRLGLEIVRQIEQGG